MSTFEKLRVAYYDNYKPKVKNPILNALVGILLILSYGFIFAILGLFALHLMNIELESNLSNYLISAFITCNIFSMFNLCNLMWDSDKVGPYLGSVIISGGLTIGLGPDINSHPWQFFGLFILLNTVFAYFIKRSQKKAREEREWKKQWHREWEKEIKEMEDDDPENPSL